MKYLKRFNQIQEAVGVPKGITEAAKNLFDSINEKLSANDVVVDIKNGDPDKYRYKTREIDIKFPISLKANINDYEVEEFNIKIKITEVQRPVPDDAEVTGAFFSPNAKINRKNFSIEYNETKKVTIGIRLDFPWTGKVDKQFWKKEVINLLLKNKTEVLSSLGHELMHSYDLAFIKGGKSFHDVADYNSTSDLRFGIPAVDTFFFYLYFMQKCESVVRSVELATRMDAQGITQEQFLDFIQKDRSWKLLKDISKWTYKDFHKEIIDNVDLVKLRLGESGINTDGMGPEEVANFLEEIILKNLANAKVEVINDLLEDPKYSQYDNDFFRMLALLSNKDNDPDEEEKEKYFNEFIEKIKKDVRKKGDFFVEKEKMFKFESEKLMRKLSKLFSMAKDTKVNALQAKISAKKPMKTESILNWDKYQYALGVKTKISNKNLF